MVIQTDQVFDAVDSIVDYGMEKKLIDQLDKVFSRNSLLSILHLDYYVKTSGRKMSLIEALDILRQYALEAGLAENTASSIDLFDTSLMGVLTPRPSEVLSRFQALYSQSPKTATDWFYEFSQDVNYIRRDRVAKDINWTSETKYGGLELSINLSKPEKDPRDIALAKKKLSTGYPACLLCVENEGYAGHIAHPARQNLRIIPIKIGGENWGFQYSPYVYYNEHCIVMSNEHRPMVIDDLIFGKLFDFLEIFPHYFIGSNADLPIVGGSILSHEHFQGGRHEFPMARARHRERLMVSGFEDIGCSVLDYPMSVIRITGRNRQTLCALAQKILSQWREYSDPESMIFSYTSGERHNTITPIARMRGNMYELDLVLRNNRTTAEYPMGLFHPHEHLHHIKKENIGLIEVMGLAVLPGRLSEEMRLLKDMILSGVSPRSDERTAKHADWYEKVILPRNDLSLDTADGIIRQEISAVFAEVLECAGVFKSDEAGRKAALRFAKTFGGEKL